MAITEWLLKHILGKDNILLQHKIRVFDVDIRNAQPVLIESEDDNGFVRIMRADSNGLVIGTHAAGDQSIATQSETAGIPGDADITIRPPEGEEWDITFLSGVHDGAAPKTMDIRLTDGTISVYLLPFQTMNAPASVEVPIFPAFFDSAGVNSLCSVGGGYPVPLTRDVYMIVHYDGIGNGKTGTVNYKYRKRAVPTDA